MESGKQLSDLVRCSNGPLRAICLFTVNFSHVAIVEKGYGSKEYQLLMKNLHLEYLFVGFSWMVVCASQYEYDD